MKSRFVVGRQILAVETGQARENGTPKAMAERRSADFRAGEKRKNIRDSEL